MSQISITDLRNLFTKALVAIFDEEVDVKEFGRSFFKSTTSTSKNVSWQVRRTTEQIAEQQVRGSLGQRNQATRSTEKMATPPYYSEYFNATEMAIYDTLFGKDGNIDAGAFAEFVKEVARETLLLKDKINRAKELQCWQVLLDGIVQAKEGNFDYRRKAGSFNDLLAGTWDVNTVDPREELIAGATFLRNVGKVQDTVYDIVLGRDAYQQMINNDIFIKSMDVRRITLGEINTPRSNAVGASLMGEIAFGEFAGRLWLYKEIYEDSAGSPIKYMDDQKLVMLPSEGMPFLLSHAQVPMLATDTNMRKEGEFFISDHIDARKKTHEYVVESSVLAVPVAVDKIYTSKVAS